MPATSKDYFEKLKELAESSSKLRMAQMEGLISGEDWSTVYNWLKEEARKVMEEFKRVIVEEAKKEVVTGETSGETEVKEEK
ncbi:MAG: hypothetical protein ABIM54_00970 [candidate division WOR-3 bacterium]